MNTPDSLKARIGQEVGVSDWCLVDQDMIDRFADLTDDHQWIHVDREAAAQAPFVEFAVAQFVQIRIDRKRKAAVEEPGLGE